MEIWRKRNLPRPPESTHLYSSQDLQKLGPHLKKIIKETKKLSFCINKDGIQHYHREVLCLGRILYQYGRHRTEKFFILLKKVEKCAKRFLEMKFYEQVSLIRALLPDSLALQSPFRFPSKIMYDYLLILAVGAFHVLLQLDNYCLQAAQLLMKKIASGHFFASAAVLVASVSRLRSYALDIANSIATYCGRGAEHAFSLIGTSYEGCEKSILNKSLHKQLQKHLSVSYSQKDENQGCEVTVEEEKPGNLKKECTDNQEGENETTKPKKKRKRKKKKGNQLQTEEIINLCSENIGEKVSSNITKRKQPLEHSEQIIEILSAEDIGEGVVGERKSKLEKGEVEVNIEDIGEVVVRPVKRKIKKGERDASIKDVGEEVCLKKKKIQASTDNIGEIVFRPKKSKLEESEIGISTDVGEPVVRPKKSKLKGSEMRTSTEDIGEAVMKLKKSKLNKGGKGISNVEVGTPLVKLKKKNQRWKRSKY
ncbi:uncharacterized protein LOC143041490 [Oratosquilla oratoria]|uniref:uncharacterized protein LOC143041490 n=1 Tax=Oratosquilla oratoria TaxID=337810 RepID=UPI003F760103